MIPRLRPPYGLVEYLAGALRRSGGKREQFESAFAEAFGFPHGLFFPYGRSAVFALLKALDWRDRQVVMPAYTCAVVPHAVFLSGNRPEFVDCEAGHFNVSAQRLAECSVTTADMVIPTPVFGYPLDNEAYRGVLAKRFRRSFVLFDVAHAFAISCASSDGVEWADGALFGLGIGKMLSATNGGMLLLRDAEVHKSVRSFRDRWLEGRSVFAELTGRVYGLAAWAAFREPFLTAIDYLEHNTSLLYRFTDKYYGKVGPSLPDEARARPLGFQAALGASQLRRIDALVAQRRAIASHYEQSLSREGFSVFESLAMPTYSHFPLVVGDRAAVLGELRRHGVQAGQLIDYCCPDLPGYEAHRGTAPHAAWFAARMINLPNWAGMRIRQAERVVAALVRIRERIPYAFEASASS